MDIFLLDGMLLWIEKPFLKEGEKVGVDSGKFYCDQKAKFGLNLQGVCDAHCRFTFISVQHPASASDYLSFVSSSLYQQLMEGSGLQIVIVSMETMPMSTKHICLSLSPTCLLAQGMHTTTTNHNYELTLNVPLVF